MDPSGKDSTSREKQHRGTGLLLNCFLLPKLFHVEQLTSTLDKRNVLDKFF